jgi:hypothetical protein
VVERPPGWVTPEGVDAVLVVTGPAPLVEPPPAGAALAAAPGWLPGTTPELSLAEPNSGGTRAPHAVPISDAAVTSTASRRRRRARTRR